MSVLISIVQVMLHNKATPNLGLNITKVYFSQDMSSVA